MDCKLLRDCEVLLSFSVILQNSGGLLGTRPKEEEIIAEEESKMISMLRGIVYLFYPV